MVDGRTSTGPEMSRERKLRNRRIIGKYMGNRRIIGKDMGNRRIIGKDMGKDMGNTRIIGKFMGNGASEFKRFNERSKPNRAIETG